jgi:hypothetical protein
LAPCEAGSGLQTQAHALHQRLLASSEDTCVHMALTFQHVSLANIREDVRFRECHAHPKKTCLIPHIFAAIS